MDRETQSNRQTDRKAETQTERLRDAYTSRETGKKAKERHSQTGKKAIIW